MGRLLYIDEFGDVHAGDVAPDHILEYFGITEVGVENLIALEYGSSSAEVAESVLEDPSEVFDMANSYTEKWEWNGKRFKLVDADYDRPRYPAGVFLAGNQILLWSNGGDEITYWYDNEELLEQFRVMQGETAVVGNELEGYEGAEEELDLLEIIQEFGLL